MDALFIKDESTLKDHLASHRKTLKKIFKAEIKASFANKYRQYRNDSFNVFYQELHKNKAIEVPKEAPKVPLSYIQALFKDGALKPLKTITIPGPVIEESDNEVEVEAETKAAEGMARASERISRRNRR
jgi:ketol-acid reductoisomerase